MELLRKEGVNNILAFRVLLAGMAYSSFLKRVNFLLPMASSAGDCHLKPVCTWKDSRAFGESDTVTFL